LHAGPSDQSAPVHSRLIGVFPWRRPLNIGSIVMTSGSTYVKGGADGPHSRGGVVMVLAGSAGLPGAWAFTPAGTNAAAPAPTPTALMNLRREITLPVLRPPRSGAMTSLRSKGE